MSRSRAGRAPAGRSALADGLRALDRAYSRGHHGRWSARRRAELVDGSLRSAFRSEASAGIAVVALGGYGRGELAPGSDIDVLLLHRAEDASTIRRVAEAVLYPLWDTGLAVGHASRTPEDCLTMAAGRLDAATAIVDGRLVDGDGQLFAEMRELVFGWLREDSRGFAARLLEAAAERADRHGSASQLLEPELKEGAGGLRDISSLGWLRAVVGETGDASTLDGVGLLRTAERDAVDEAHEFLVRVRSALHLSTGRRTDRLLLEQQAEIARDLGFADEPGLAAVDALMRTLFAHARQVEHVVGSVFERFLVGEVAAAIAVDAPTPGEAIEAFAESADEGRPLSASALDRIQAADLPPQIGWTSPVREAFLRILRSPDAVRTLEAMDRIDLLVRYLPEWRAVRCRPQRDPYHRYTVDVHLLRTLGEMSRLLEGASSEPLNGARAGGDADPIAVEAARLVGRDDGLLLGALLHDIGKIGEGAHVDAGARVAAAALSRMGIHAEPRELALFLVGEHLLLPDTATRRDLADDELILRVAARIGSPERLAALYLLVRADAAATGPQAWTPWRRALVHELVAKVQRVFDHGDVGTESATELAAAVASIRAIAGADDAIVEAFLRRMPSTYLRTVAPDEAVAHLRLLAEPLSSPTEVRTVAAPGRRHGTYALTVVAVDRPGLLSWVAGALSIAGLSILTAKVFTTDDGIAVDLFEVQGEFEIEVGDDRWRQFRSSLRRAIEGRLSLESGVRERRRHYPRRRGGSPVSVTIDAAASGLYTVIEVAAPDRIGLLYDITRTLAELSLDVHLAKVATYGERVIDAFYVREIAGGKLEDPSRIETIRAALASRAES